MSFGFLTFFNFFPCPFFSTAPSFSPQAGPPVLIASGAFPFSELLFSFFRELLEKFFHPLVQP